MTRSLILFSLFSLFIICCKAQFVPLGQAINGSSSDDRIGYEISLNYTGNILAIGSPFKGSTGEVNMYEFDGTSWVPMGNAINGSAGGESFGWSVALNAAGDRVAIAAPFFNSRIGRVKIYEFNDTSWVELGSDILGEASGDLSGWDIDLNAAGDRVVIGARLNDGNGSNSGHARVFELISGNWTQLGQDIDGEFGNDRSGIKVSINNPGDIIATSSSRNGGGRGHVRIFRLIGSTWTLMGQDIDGENGGDSAGEDIDLNGAGNRIAVGAKRNTDSLGVSSGHARVFEYDTTLVDWVQMGDELQGEGSGDFFGLAVSLNDAGDRIIVGGKLNDGSASNAGHARVFDFDGSAWLQVGMDIDGQGADYNLGHRVTIDSLGEKFAISANIANAILYREGQVIAFEECPDKDGDGYRDIACGGTDCNDNDSTIHPGALEICDGIDNNCNRLLDGADPDLVDHVSPVAACQAVTAFLDANGNTHISFADVDGGSSDACSSIAFSLSTSTYDCSQIGANLTTLVVTDGFGNTASCVAHVTVSDNTPPAAKCQDIMVTLDANGQANINQQDVDAGSSDACGIAGMTISSTFFDCQHVGSQVTTLTVTDMYNNTANCQAVVSVIDTTQPHALCQDLHVFLNSNGRASVRASDLDNGSYDFCGIANLSLSNSEFDCDQIGKNTVYLTAKDDMGNSDKCQAFVTVQDTLAPTAICQSISVFLDVNGYAHLFPQEVDGGSYDACRIAKSEVYPYRFDCDHIGVNAVMLTLTDPNNNRSYCQTTVTVVDTTAPRAICQDVSVYLNAKGTASIQASDIDAGSFDACNLVSRDLSVANFGCRRMTNNYTELRLTDTHGNTASCKALVTLLDTVAPQAVCQPSKAFLTPSGRVTINPLDVDRGSYDVCGLASMSVFPDTFDCNQLGPNFINLVVSDYAGNTSICQTSVTVLDTSRLSAICGQDSYGKLSPIPLDNNTLTIFPNPSNGRFKLRAGGLLEGEWRYKLSDQLGRTLLVGKLQDREKAFDIRHLPSGHYFFLLISPEGKQYLERVVKK